MHRHGRRTIFGRMKASLGRRYRLRAWTARVARSVGSMLPGWRAPTELADRLAYVRSCYGPSFLNTPGDRTFVLCVQGYGRFLSDAIANRDRRFQFLDIGANLGLFSILAAANPRCERVIAIEPLPKVYGNLQANIRRNRAWNVVAIRGAVAGTLDPIVHLTFDRHHSGLSRVVSRDKGSVDAPVISAAMLDDLLPGTGAGIVAKIDVEGSEAEVIAKLRKCRFYGAIEEILIEVSERNLGPDTRAKLLCMLAEDGFVEVSRAGAAEHYDAILRRRGVGEHI